MTAHPQGPRRTRAIVALLAAGILAGAIRLLRGRQAGGSGKFEPETTGPTSGTKEPMGTPECRVLFDAPAACIRGSGASPALHVALPLLAGAGDERLLPGPCEPVADDGWFLFRRDDFLAGFAVAESGEDLETATGRLYERMFEIAGSRHLYRVWNYVPEINASSQGLENYRRFCRARSVAFESRFGAGFRSLLPAASAVGAEAGPLAIGFLSGCAEPLRFESPRQVPAFDYPREYGPRPPSFSRATAVAAGGQRLVFVSGTAAIRGHASVASRDIDGQLRCTIDNLALIADAAGAGPDLRRAGRSRRFFKVLLRNPADLAVTQDRLAERILRPGDTVSYLRADICRPELLVEVEATFAD